MTINNCNDYSICFGKDMMIHSYFKTQTMTVYLKVKGNNATLIIYQAPLKSFPLNKSKMLYYFKSGLQNPCWSQQQHIDANALVQQSNNNQTSIEFDLNTIKRKSIALISTQLKAFCLCSIMAHYGLLCLQVYALNKLPQTKVSVCGI